MCGPSIRWRSSGLQIAIKQAKKHGLLGARIFEAPFNFTIDLRIGAGAFVCGEETALMASIEGKRGVPRPRPPFPAESGLWGCPTLINNVETFANIAPIIRHGAEWFAGIGTEKSKGTKVFALAGKITNTGIIEVPMGTPLREIVEEMGGGAPDGGKVKAVQTGGPSGGCIPAQHLDTPVDYESLATLGSIMGSGGMIVMDETNQHGRCGPLFHGVLPRRILRQVHSLPRRHGADAPLADQNHRRARRPPGTSRSSRNSATW